jgi:hypothetical protein
MLLTLRCAMMSTHQSESRFRFLHQALYLNLQYCFDLELELKCNVRLLRSS